MENGSGLHLVIIEVTERCNLRCSHCYVGGYSDFSKDMSPFQFQQVLDQIACLGVSFVSLSGGEPLLLGERVFQYAALLKSYGIHTTLVTNGLLISRYSAGKYAPFDHIQISMDGPREVHDAIRGRGSHDALIDAVEHLRAEAAERLSLRMTLHSANFRYLAETYRTAKGLGVRFSVERFTQPPGHCAQGISLLTPGQLQETLEFCREHNIHSLDPLMNMLRHVGKGGAAPLHRVTGGCTAGIAGVAVTAGLDLLPCVRIRKPAGNIASHSLADLWSDSELLHSLRDRHSFNGCGACHMRCVCGGCRAVSFADTGSVTGHDTQCWIVQ